MLGGSGDKLFLVKSALLGGTLLAAYWLLSCRTAWVGRCAELLDRVAQRRGLCFLLLAVTPMMLRLAALPWAPPPVPRVSDEFSHLLVGDTLRAGRLANPVHEFWRHFETQYVFHQPTYASAYPPGQGALLAFGQLCTGHPWAGVLLAAGILCGAVYWMLLGWMTPMWAFAGGWIALLNFGVSHKWLESYWGGTVAALGGALLFGALPRLWGQPSGLNAAILIGGWALIWHTRPYEAAVLAVALTPLMLVWLARRGRRACAAVLPPVLAGGSLCGAFFLYYNWRLTGSAWLMPYQLHQKLYGVPQSFVWQRPITGPIPERKNLRDNFEWQYQARARHATLSGFVTNAATVAWRFWMFYFGYLGRGLPLVVLLVSRRWLAQRRVLAVMGVMVVGLGGSLLYWFFQEHYVACYTAPCVMLLLLGLRQVWEWRWGGRPAGPALALAMLVTVPLTKWRVSDPTAPAWQYHRAAIQEKLEQAGGRHLVFVRYSDQHDFEHEWVYNSADIDGSRVVWAQPLDPASDAALVRYFADRQIWWVEADQERPVLTPFTGRERAPQPQGPVP
jgi:hypothetical protein